MDVTVRRCENQTVKYGKHLKSFEFRIMDPERRHSCGRVDSRMQITKQSRLLSIAGRNEVSYGGSNLRTEIFCRLSPSRTTQLSLNDIIRVECDSYRPFPETDTANIPCFRRVGNKIDLQTQHGLLAPANSSNLSFTLGKWPLHLIYL